MSEPDELYTLRNLFWLGNFQVLLYIIEYGKAIMESAT
jgi:hypothetical protein